MFSKKLLVVFAIIVTLLTGVVSKGHWSGGYIGGVGVGFPFYYWREVTGTDIVVCVEGDPPSCKPQIVSADRQGALILSAVSFIGDIFFWFVVLYLTKKTARFVSKNN